MRTGTVQEMALVDKVWNDHYSATICVGYLFDVYHLKGCLDWRVFKTVFFRYMHNDINYFARIGFDEMFVATYTMIYVPWDPGIIFVFFRILCAIVHFIALEFFIKGVHFFFRSFFCFVCTCPSCLTFYCQRVRLIK